MKETHDYTRRLYNKIAEWYHDLRTKDSGWFYNEMLEMPTTLKLLGNVKDKKILDLGCGTGIYAKVLTNKGAIIRCIDISEEMIKIAKKGNPKIEFKIGNMDNLPYKDKEFDVVLAALSLEYSKDWDPIFKEVKRVLKDNGLFVFSGSNPVIDVAKKVVYRGRKFRIVKDYFKEGFRETKWTTEHGAYIKIRFYHKTYGTIVKTILRNGFEIIDYEDAFPIDIARKKFPKDYKLWSNMPFFCTWKIMKR
ncbi:MAG TPA: methyltransferase domain-containing protein [Candidatus Nanoarchaeia archaeon]|nr:methyltransferase domain-containing protein [Candidatus Nanoarchaeia archaeon]